MSFRDIKNKARSDLHGIMRVAARYYAPGSMVAVPINVRIHTKLNKQLGDLKGTSFSYAETEDQVPKVLFWRNEIDPVNKSVVVVLDSAGEPTEEGYRVDHTQPPDGLTITAEVARMMPADMIPYLV